jgi:hypothetical protein
MRKDYISAIKLAIKLDKPYQLLGIFGKIERSEEYGKEYLDSIIDRLNPEQVNVASS